MPSFLFKKLAALAPGQANLTALTLELYYL
jgi:hypothetical protein